MKILIAGYYGFDNVGDEAILSVILADLKQRRKSLEIIVVSGNPEKTTCQHQVRSILWTDIPAIMDACRESDLIILGGGGLFHDYWGTSDEHILTQNHSGISFYSCFPLLAALYEKNIALYAIGVGPLFTDAGKKLTRQSFVNSDLIMVRDPESLGILRDLGIPVERFSVTEDPAFLLPSDHEKAHRILSKVRNGNEHLVAVSLRNWGTEVSSENWMKELADALDKFSDKYDAGFIFIPFQLSPATPLTDDLGIAKNVVSMMRNSSRAIILEDEMDPETISGLIAQCDLVVGMRLHSLIFSVKNAIPAIGLAYDPKVANLMRRSGLDQFSLDFNQLNSKRLFELMDNAWTKREQTKSLLDLKKGKLKKMAEENGNLIMQFLEEPVSASTKKLDRQYIQDLLLRQTYKLAEEEKKAHTLWLQLENGRNRPQPNGHLQAEPLHADNVLPRMHAPHRPDIICFSIIEWDFRYQRPQQIMSQFAAQGHRVFYISTARFLSIDSAPAIHIRVIKENVFEIRISAHHVPDLYGETISGDNFAAMIDSLDELRRQYQIHDAISYVMIASWGDLALEIRDRWNWQVLYDCMDEWDNFPLVKNPIVDAERRLVRDCDLLVVTSQRLFDKWQGQNAAILLARNAADYEFYSQYYAPNTLLENVNRPIVGYYGAIADWFDLDLMIYIAENRPEYTFVLIGGVFDMDVSCLQGMSNVMLLGQQPYETMPRYLYNFDVCIIPFKINAITDATDPVKIYEYMCGGKPVVSVNLSELNPYRELLYLADDKDDFLVKLDRALVETDDALVERRKKFAWQNTWDKRVLSIGDALDDVSGKRAQQGSSLSLILPAEYLISGRRMPGYDGVDYWQLVYEKDNVVYKQTSLNLAEREHLILSGVSSEYFPSPLDCISNDDYSVVVFPKHDGLTLRDSIPALNSSADEFYRFIVHCLNILDDLQENNLIHRNIRRNNILIKDNKPFLLGFGWAISYDEEMVYPFGLGGSERPTDGGFSDVYSIGKILEYVSQRSYPAYDRVIALMVAGDVKIRIKDLGMLRMLFNAAHLAAEESGR